MGWLSGWENRRKITISNTNVDAILSNFPILIKISASSGTGSTDITDIFTELTGDANRKKIAVTTSDGTTQCYIEIERFDFANSLAWFWVKVPSVAADSATELYIYYDVAQADNTTYVGDTTDVVTHNVWDANFKLVMHMAQDPNGDVADAIKDSTSNANHGTPAGGMTTADLVDGKIGKAIDFDGINDSIDCGNHNSLDITTAITIEGCVKSTEGRLCIVAGKIGGNDYHENNYLLKLNADNTAIFIVGDGVDWDYGSSTSALFVQDIFSHIAASWDGSNISFYGDGVLKGSPVLSFTAASVVSSLFIAKDNFNNQWLYKGIQDEIRISNTARSDAWIKATYYSNWDGLVAFSAAEEIDSYLDENISVNSEFDDNWPEVDENISVNSEFTYFESDSPISDDISVNSEFVCLVADSPISEEVSVNANFVSEHTGEISEEASVNSEIAVMHQQSGELSEDASVSSAFAVARHLTITDTLFSWDTLKWGWLKSIADSLDIADIASKILGIPVKEWLTLTDTETNNWSGTEAISDSFYTVDISEAVKVYYDLIADGMAITDAVNLALGLIITDILTCTDTVLDIGTFQHSIEDGMTIEDIAERLFPKSISDSFAATDTSLVDFLALLQISDSFNAADTAAGLTTINKAIADSLAILDTVTVQQLLQELIQDGLNLEVLIELEDEVWQAWVLNTAAFHPSIYSGYNYNSFAIDPQNEVVYGCKSDGIYELTGDTDNGAAFHSGFILPESYLGSSNNKRFRSAFFGVSGNAVVLKMSTDNGWRTYRVTDMEAKLTRDLKGRKWEISLADFDDVDFIELISVILSKK